MNATNEIKTITHREKKKVGKNKENVPRLF